MLKTSPYLTIEKAAELLTLHPKTLMKWRHQRRGPKYLKFGGRGRVRYRREDIDAFIAASVIDPAAAAVTRNRSRRRQLRAPDAAVRVHARKPAA
jgi:excisionase family DNA binding protein